ncbi:hypothetical protein [Shewanella surugensis]|uniref:Glycine zipper family protein n=1 Tax=Shewanella surugensis TaxID=212020 RepID=A0ABT0LIQ3_9GAMM|nr:hypothetical protein [Shewanella surugensis]MCL1127578.1 hypothetical protein [Shewanella surugensis]
MRCKQSNAAFEMCETNTEDGANFSAGVLLDSNDYENDITALDQIESNPEKTFELANNNGTLYFDTMPSITDLQTFLAKYNMKIRLRFRMQVGFSSNLVGTNMADSSGVNSTIILELNYTPSKWVSDLDTYGECKSEKCKSPVANFQVTLADEVYQPTFRPEQAKKGGYYAEMGLKRSHSFNFPLVRTNMKTVDILGSPTKVAVYDYKYMKHKATYGFSVNLYAFGYIDMFDANILPDNIAGFNDLILTGWAGPSATWQSMQSTKSITEGFVVGAIGAAIGCGAGGYLGSFYGEQIDDCVAGSQLGEAIGVMTFGSFTKKVKTTGDAGLIVSTRAKIGSLFAGTLEGMVKGFGYQPKNMWDSKANAAIELRTELMYTVGRQSTGNSGTGSIGAL